MTYPVQLRSPEKKSVKLYKTLHLLDLNLLISHSVFPSTVDPFNKKHGSSLSPSKNRSSYQDLGAIRWRGIIHLSLITAGLHA